MRPTLISRVRAVALAIACITLAVPAAFAANYHIARCVLRVSEDAMPDIDRALFPVGRAVVLTGSPGADLYGIGTAMGAVAINLPTNSELLIPLDEVERANPHPPVTATEPFYTSFGYIGKDGRYHQITFYMGEALHTPSPLLRWADGGDDHSLCYTVYLSRSAGEAAIHVDKVNWSAWDNGAYDAFTELTFAMAATSIEVPMLILGLYLYRRHRRSLVLAARTRR